MFLTDFKQLRQKAMISGVMIHRNTNKAEGNANDFQKPAN